MARIIKPEEKWHQLRVRSDRNNGELLLVGTGRNAYLWAGCDGNGAVVIFTGQQTLRKIAKAILANVPERKRK